MVFCTSENKAYFAQLDNDPLNYVLKILKSSEKKINTIYLIGNALLAF